MCMAILTLPNDLKPYYFYFNLDIGLYEPHNHAFSLSPTALEVEKTIF